MFGSVSVLTLPLVVLFVLLALFIGMALFSRNYLKVSPNAVAVLSGRKRKLSDGRLVGYRMVRGGAALRIPLLEKVDYLSLNVFTIPLEIKRAYTLQGVPVSVKAVANVKIRGDEVSLQAAAERFLGMKNDEIQRVIFQTLEGHLRSILGTLTVEEVNSDRHSFAQKLTTEAAMDLEKMGIGVDVLTIQEISDEEDYLNALGRLAHRGGKARCDYWRSRGPEGLQDPLGPRDAGRRTRQIRRRRIHRPGAAGFRHAPGAVPGGDRDGKGEGRPSRSPGRGQG